MTSILLMLLLSVIRTQCVSPVPSCPASCVVCSEDALICHRLANIIDAPGTTQALLLTEGSISTVQPASLSDLSNVTVIGLSHNHISVLGEKPFRNLPFLNTLLLDHNLLTSQALQGGALTNLTRLEVLALGQNLINMIQGVWFEGNKALRSLKLEGNLLTSLDPGSFPLNDLRDLESLDLSDNLIYHLHRNTLWSLQTLDLSRNRLSSAPAEAFSYLSWLTNLNLDLNTWNCSCQLLELAAFLSTFIQQPDKTLYNGRRMVCVSADNPAVTTVLELTEANCVPSNQNITVQIEARGSVTPQLYARDLAITAVVCFIGGVGLTLLVVLICYQVSWKKKLKESKRQKEEEEEGSSTGVNHHANHLDASEKRRDLFLQSQRSQPWDREAKMLDARTDGYGGQNRSRVDENGHFGCPYCSTKGQRGMDQMRARGNSRINGGMETEEEGEKRRMRMMIEEERRRLGTQQGISGSDIPNKLLSHSNTNSSSHPRKDTFSQRSETLADNQTNREMGESYRTDMEGKSRGHETVHCESCHRTYRPPEQSVRHGRIHTKTKDSALFDGFPSQYRQIDRGRYDNYNQFDMTKNTELRREPRNVTFDLKSSRSLEQGGSQREDQKETEETRRSRDKERGRAKKHEAKVQSSRLLKVKLNLNPLLKSKVHPKRKNELGHSEESSSKKSKDKRQDGKERRERVGKGKSGEKTKGNGEKVKKSTKTKGSTEGGEEEKEEKDGGEGGQKSKKSSKQKKDKQENTEVNQGENTPPENSQPGDTANTADQSASAPAIGQGQDFQGGSIQSQGAGLVLGSSQLSSQHPLSLSATDRNHTTNLSLLGLASSQLTGSSLSLQGGNLLLNTMASGSTALFPSGPAKSVAPSIAISGAPDSFSRQPGVGLVSPATSLLANAVLANPFKASAMHTSALHISQPAGLASSLAANPAPMQSLSQSKPPPDSSPLAVRLMSVPGQEPGLQTGDGVLQRLALQTQAPPSADGLSGVTPQAPGPETTVENVSNSNSKTESGRVGGGSTANMSAEGGALSGGLAAGLSGGIMQAADASVSGVPAPITSTQSTSSPGDGFGDPALLQQEYLSEEEGSSPRRKLRLVIPEKTSDRPPTALERKIR